MQQILRQVVSVRQHNNKKPNKEKYKVYVVNADKSSQILSELKNWFHVREGKTVEFEIEGNIYGVTDDTPQIISCGPYNESIELQICEGCMISELDAYNTMALRVEQGDKILIGRDDIKLKIRGFDCKSNIRSKNVVITCNNK